MRKKDADRIANSGAIWYGSTPFALTCLSNYLGLFGYTMIHLGYIGRVSLPEVWILLGGTFCAMLCPRGQVVKDAYR